MVNNQGIVHLKVGPLQTACRNRKAHMYVSFEKYGEETLTCKRCDVHYQHMLLSVSKQAAKLVAEKV